MHAVATTRRTRGATASVADEAAAVTMALDSFERTLAMSATTLQERQHDRSLSGGARVRHDSASWRSSSAHSNGSGDAVAAAALPLPPRRRARHTAALRAAAFADAEQRSLLRELLRVQDAARWLTQCPRATLRRLQSRVLDAVGVHVLTFAGLPTPLLPYVRRYCPQLLPPSYDATRASPPLLDDNNNDDNDDNDDDNDDDEQQFVRLGDETATGAPLPPPPLSFAQFLRSYVSYDDNDATTTATTDTAATTACAWRRGVLRAGRGAPVRPLTLADVYYGVRTVEEALAPSRATTADNNNGDSNNNDDGDDDAAAVTFAARLEGEQATLGDVLHWCDFFSAFFDEAREGLCRDPLNLWCAVLLACGAAAAADAAIADAAQNDKHDDDNERRPQQWRCDGDVVSAACATHSARRRCHAATCAACALAAAAAAQRHAQARKRQPARRRGNGGVCAAPLFLATPAALLWSQSFLQLHRGAADDGGGDGDNAAKTMTASSSSRAVPRRLRAGEVFAIRDFVAAAAALDLRRLDGDDDACEALQLLLPRSCAHAAPRRAWGVTAAQLRVAAAALTPAQDDAVACGGGGAMARALLSRLRRVLPVTAYYLTYRMPTRPPYVAAAAASLAAT